MTDAVIPHNAEAERALIGALVTSRYQAEVIRAMVIPEDFYDPTLGGVYAAYMTLIDEGLPTDVVTVSQRAQVERQWLGQIMAASPSSANAVAYARIVVELASRRRFLDASHQIREAAVAPGVEYGDIVNIADEALRKAQLPIAGIADGESIDQFYAAAALDPDWVIHGLISRQDRVLLVAGEGHGKSMLMHQVLGCAAAGVHPFGRGEIDPIKVLLVDLENPRALLQRRLRAMWEKIEPLASGPVDPSNFQIVSRTEGIDVTHRPDEMRLADEIGYHRPDIVAIGPAYKLHESAEENSSEVRQVLKVLDRIRTRFRCAMLIETHAPHEAFRRGPNGERPKIRPAGSRLWIRWPEMVLGLEPKAEHRMADGEWLLTNVRPPREERQWPKKLRRGFVLPWVEDEPVRDNVWGNVGETR